MKYASDIKRFLRDWMLVIAMSSGICGYLLFAALDFPDSINKNALDVVKVLQPTLIFLMLFLTFCRVDLHRLKLCRWQFWLLLGQGGGFAILAVIATVINSEGLKVILEGAMLCLICPTATAAAVVTRKLGGDVAHITSYTILINVLCSILVPLMVPLMHPETAKSFADTSLMIAGKVYPLLLLPLFSAVVVKFLLPKFHRRLVLCADLSFYLWALALALALAVTTRSIMHSEVGISSQLCLVVVSLLCCAFQFWFGKKMGAKDGEKITGGQAMGQKNTVMIIWMGYTFFTPVTSLVGGFYSIWHNIYNTIQLKKAQNCESN